jgi:hypothetical protein
MKTDKLRREEDEKELVKCITSNATGKHREEGRKGRRLRTARFMKATPPLNGCCKYV